jgi:hypothetical protein
MVGFLRRAACCVTVGVLLLATSGGRTAQAQVKVLGTDVLAMDPDANNTAAACISIVGARNGTFCGKVFVVTTGPLAGLKATPGDLKAGAATIPASAVGARCTIAWENTNYTWPQGPDILYDEAPAEIPSGRTAVWVSVRVPKDAKPGVYTGAVKVEAKGLPPTQVPVKIDVRDWTVPDPQDYRTWAELIEQPDTLAVDYDVPLWSDKHWEMIARSFQLIADTGSRVVYVPIIARTNYGNAESMVRWIKKGENQYDYDFSIVDKYLDCVEKNLGKPKVISIYAWETYLRQPKSPGGVPPEVKGSEGSYEWREAMAAKNILENSNRGPAVTVLDPKTGKTETIYLLRYEDPAAKALWKPVWDGLRERITKRGWDKAMMISSYSDYYPLPQEIAVLNDLSGNMPWAGCAHHINSVVVNKTLGKIGAANIGYAASALDQFFDLDPSKQAPCYGWKQSTLYAQYHRFHVFNESLLSVRYQVERLITGNKRGVAHIGADFWPAVRNKAGKRTGIVTDRFPESYWHSLNVMGWLLGPGPKGPVGTTRLDTFREGLYECEARIAIEAALSEEPLKSKLGAELAKRAQDCLDGRLVDIWKGVGVSDEDFAKYPLITQYRDWYFEVGKRATKNAKPAAQWFLGSGWQARNAKLFDLAGEVTRKLAEK